MLNLPPRSRQNPTFNVQEQNAILSELAKVPSGLQIDGKSFVYEYNEFTEIDVLFDQSVDPYSVFTIRDGSRPFDYQRATPAFELPPGPIYLTNGASPATSGMVLECWLLGPSRPHRLRYSGTAPAVGDRLAPVDGETYLAVEDNGPFVALSEPAEGTVWCANLSSNESGVSVFKVQATECKQVGDSVSCNLFQWNGSSWEDSGTDITVHDEGNHVFLLANEFAWARQEPGIERYDFVGEYGLSRKGVAQEHIARGSSGDVSIYLHGTSSSDPCEGEDSECIVEVCNPELSGWVVRNIREDDHVHIRYYDQKWFIIPVPQTLMLCKSDSLIGNNETATVTAWGLSSGTLAEISGYTFSARNVSGQGLIAGTLLSAIHYENCDVPLLFPLELNPCS